MSDMLSYAILLVFALNGDIVLLSIGAGVAMHPFSNWLNLRAALAFTFIHSVMALLAINTGFLLADFILNFSFQAGIVIIGTLGLKTIIEANAIKNDKRTFLYEDFTIVLSSALASSFNTFLAFLAYGLIMPKYSLYSIIILAVFVFLTVIAGIFIGNKYRPQYFGRFSKYFGGLIFLVIAIYLAMH